MDNNDKIERFKNIVDSMFSKLEETESKLKEKVVAPKPSTPIRRVLDQSKLEATIDKEIEENSPAEGMQNEVLELAIEELEIVREAFLAFQEHIEDLAIFQFIYPEIEEFVEFCLDLVELVENDFDVENLRGKSLEQYQKIQKLRARILSAIYMKYKKKQ